MKILLFGCTGQVGWQLQRSLAPLGKLIALHTKSSAYAADFSKPHALMDTVLAIQPDVIVNAAAYTAVDKAQSETEICKRINADAPAVLAQAAIKTGAILVHYSSDYVFDGSGSQARDESALTGDSCPPLSVYGQTKLAAEQAILKSGCQHLIFRTSWVYASRGGNFAKTMLGLAKTRESLKIIDDQIGAPTSAELIADVTAHAIRVCQDKPNLLGLYHLAAAGQTSWYGYANFVFETAKAQGQTLTLREALAIPTEQYPTPAKRPLNSRLNCEKLQTNFGLQLPFWQTGVERMLTEILQ